MAALPALTPAAADAVDAPSGPTPDVPDVPALGPETRGPVTGAYRGGPATAILVPRDQAAGPALAGLGLLKQRGAYTPDWELHAGGLVFSCQTAVNRGTIFVEGAGAIIASQRHCTGRFDSDLVFSVTMSDQSYLGVQMRMTGTIVAAPMLV